jgi:hypothetical protein
LKTSNEEELETRQLTRFSWNDGERDRKRVFSVMVDSLLGLKQRRVFPIVKLARVMVSIKLWKMAACHIDSDSMSYLKDVAHRPHRKRVVV